MACIAGPSSMPLCSYRTQGYIQALRRAGIAVEERYMTYGNFTFEAGAQAVSQLMAQPSPPTAIFCQSDVMAIGALQQAKKLGFRVPQDLSIIGFDDIKFSEFCDPPLTTVSQPRYEIGRQSMTLLLNMLKGQDIGTSSRLLEAKLVVRASAAPPRR